VPGSNSLGKVTQIGDLPLLVSFSGELPDLSLIVSRGGVDSLITATYV